MNKLEIFFYTINDYLSACNRSDIYQLFSFGFGYFANGKEKSIQYHSCIMYVKHFTLNSMALWN